MAASVKIDRGDGLLVNPKWIKNLEDASRKTLPLCPVDGIRPALPVVVPNGGLVTRRPDPGTLIVLLVENRNQLVDKSVTLRGIRDADPTAYMVDLAAGAVRTFGPFRAEDVPDGICIDAEPPTKMIATALQLPADRAA